MSKLTQKDLEAYVKAKNEYENQKSKIISRIHQILNFAFKTFGRKLDYWYFYGAEEGEVGPLNLNLAYGQVDSLVVSPYLDMAVVLKDGSEWGIEDGIPIYWLTEDYKKEIVEGKKLYEKKEEEKKAKAKEKRVANKKKKEKLAAQAKKKLSKEEQKALGLS